MVQDILENDKPYVPSIFFEEQLTAFEVWLSHGCQERSPPEQLPIVLQVYRSISFSLYTPKFLLADRAADLYLIRYLKTDREISCRIRIDPEL
jgi:hypothetical protein